jgi:hypothetical protein
MCIGGSPSAPAPPPPPAPIAPPPPPQDVKAPDIQASYNVRKKNAGNAGNGKMTGGTLLTGPGGVDNSTLSTGKTLLGQ